MSKLYKGEQYTYTNIDNTVFKDRKLSAKAKGVLGQMLYFPNGWNYSIVGLSKFFKDGRDSIRGAVKELEDNGYLVRKQVYIDGKFDGYDYLIFANPKNNKNADSPMTENPSTEISSTETPTQLNTKEVTTKESITNSSSLRSEDIYRDLPENLKEALKDFEEMRKLKKKPMTQRAKQMLLNKLEKLSAGDVDRKIAILEQSIGNSWTDVYELKERGNECVGQVHDRRVNQDSRGLAGTTDRSGGGNKGVGLKFPKVAYDFSQEE